MHINPGTLRNYPYCFDFPSPFRNISTFFAMSSTFAEAALGLASFGRRRSTPHPPHAEEQSDAGYEADGEPDDESHTHTTQNRIRTPGRPRSLPASLRDASARNPRDSKASVGLGLGLPSTLPSRPTRRRAGAQHSRIPADASHTPSATSDDASDSAITPIVHTPTTIESTTHAALFGLGLGLPLEYHIQCHMLESEAVSDSDLEADAAALAMYSFLPPGLSTPMPASPPVAVRTPFVVERTVPALGAPALMSTRTVTPRAPRISNVERFETDPLYS
ncbi:hypothetical protein B0H21DRAFT_278268 [Amylocystis lapponica]|nr:hypothetical protein B0H21DRAFT_278268 [Amylocystis lapponica]